MGKMKVALVQYSPEWEKPERNAEKLYAMLDDADLSDVDLLVFPELTLTGFTMNTKKFAEEIDGISFRFFIAVAVKFKTDVLGGVIEKDNGKIHNALLHVNKQGLIMARYAKIHPFSFANENKYFDSGNEPVITEAGKTKIGLSICYDLRFPELYRIYAMRGAEIIVNIANWPVTRIEHWNLLLRANAVFSQAFIVGVNRTGKDPFNEYNGNSAIVNPAGKAITETASGEKVIIAEIDAEEAKEYRAKFPFLKDAKLIK